MRIHVAGAAWLFGLGLIAPGQAAVPPLNIVIIVADDLGFGDLGCYGATRIKTPHVDRLAAGGVRFTSGYAPSSTCTPTRYSLMTGEYAWRQPEKKTAILDGDAPLCIEPGRPTLPQAMKDAGYRVPLIARWPAKIRPRVTDQMFSLVDLYATLAKIAGGKFSPESAPDRLDLSPVLLGETTNNLRDHTVLHGILNTLSLRAGDWKYVRSFRPNAGMRPGNATDLGPSPGSKDAFVRDLPGGQMARDMTLFVDDDGRAYQFYASEDNQTMHVSELSDDYLQPAGKYARIFVGRAMEAPAVFKREGKYYLLASGCTGWDPNDARSAVAENIFGPWTELGNPCRGEGAELTFGCQSTHVLPVAGQPGRFIVLFDQWKKWDLQDSRYVWLPLTFDPDGRPQIEWRARWSLSAEP